MDDATFNQEYWKFQRISRWAFAQCHLFSSGTARAVRSRLRNRTENLDVEKGQIPKAGTGRGCFAFLVSDPFSPISETVSKLDRVALP